MHSKIIFFFCYLAIINLSQADNYSLIGNSIFSELNQEDSDSLKAFVREALSEVSDKNTIRWHGANSVMGEIQPEFTYTSNNNTCRRIRIELNRSDRKPELYKFDICKAVTGWEIAVTPASFFTDSDWQRLRDEIKDTLEHAADGQPVSWVVQSTKAAGAIVPLSTEEIDGQTCRRVAISIFDPNGHTFDGRYLFCRNKSNEWLRHVK